MSPAVRVTAAASVVALALVALGTTGQALGRRPPAGNPAAVVDLTTDAGVALVGGAWRSRDARIVEVDGRGPGPDLKPSGAPLRTQDIEPRAGVAGYDDSAWPSIAPEALRARRATGRLSFTWYRLRGRVPARVGDFATAGATMVFEIVVDDYAEVWVNGQLPRVLGTAGGALVGGYNTPNRVVVARDVRPGDPFEIAVFGANGPLSDPPGNFVWVRSATLDFYRPETAATSAGRIEARHPAMAAVVPPDAVIEKLAGGFQFTEGPVWVPGTGLLFSDPNANAIYRWSDDTGVAIFRTKSGYSGPNLDQRPQPGSNGLALDPRGRLTVAEHGRRRVTRTEANGVITVLADGYEGGRLNSPNDLVYRADGSLYFTDPPFGLPEVFEDPDKDLAFSGVYRWAAGRLTLLTRELTGPNGLAFAPDERTLYVGNWDPRRKVVMRYPVLADGTLGKGQVFADLTSQPGDDAIDGIKVDRQGHVFVSGPGGLWVFDVDGTTLGRIVPAEHPHNLAWGDDDGRTLYMTAQTGLYRVRLATPGAGVSTER
jgi:gluconolactonase